MSHKENLLTNTKQWSKPAVSVSRFQDAKAFLTNGAFDTSSGANDAS